MSEFEGQTSLKAILNKVLDRGWLLVPRLTWLCFQQWTSYFMAAKRLVSACLYLIKIM